MTGGTPQLFPSAPYLSDKARFPRGYTPERMQDVVRNGPRVYGPSVSGSQSDPQVIAAQKAAKLPNRRVRDNLARSTVSMGGEMKNTQIFTGQQFDTNHITGGPTGGEYHKPVEGGRMHTVKLAPGLEDTPVLIHELGHLDSFASGRGHSSYRSPEAKGAEEAYADDYAVRNFRDRRGRASATPEGGYTRAARSYQTDHRFAQQYLASRETLPPKDNSTPRPEGWPRNHVEGQLPLLDRVSTGFDNHETADWDYTHESGMKRETSTPHPTRRARVAQADIDSAKAAVLKSMGR